jgi:hypothetical protein
MKYFSQSQSVVQSHRNQDKTWTFVVLKQPQEISSLELVTSQGRDVTKGIQPKFVYQFSSPNYYEPMEHWEVDENANVDVFEETQENYPKSFKYAEGQMNAMDEISQSYSYQGNLKLDQTRHTVETWDHESVDSEMIGYFQRSMHSMKKKDI